MNKKLLVIPLILITLFFAGTSVSAKEGVSIQGTINMNTATAEQLMILPGIGEAKAKLIIEARTQKSFQKQEDLLEVKGIGEKTLAQWAPYVAFEGKTTLQEVEIQ